MSIRACSLPALAGLCLHLAAAPAQAELLITTRPGSECVKLNDSTPDIYYTGLGAYNDSASSVSFACPVNAHYLATDAGYYFDTAYWWAYVDDNNSSLNVSCFLSSCNDTGVCTSSVTRASSGTGSNQLLSTVGTTFNLGSYTNALVLRCTVPGKVGASRSGIRKYTVYSFD